MKIKGFGIVWLLFLLYRWDNEEGVTMIRFANDVHIISNFIGFTKT